MNGMNEMQDNKMLDLYVEQYDDYNHCETCGSGSSTIYYVSEKPFVDGDIDKQSDDIVSFGSYSSCFGMDQDGTFDDVINYINKTYSKNIDLSVLKEPDDGLMFAEWQVEYDKIVIDHLKTVHGINLTITYDAAETNIWDDDDDEWTGAEDDYEDN